jgi:hypothetical protein
MSSAQVIQELLGRLKGVAGTGPSTVDARASEKDVTILEKCSLVGGSRAIAEFIAQEGELIPFKRGAILISQGEYKDYIDFIVSGEVDIFIHGQLRTTKSCPETVGELAAEEPDKPRTATVKARSNSVKVIRLKGDQFRELVSQHPEMGERLAKASRQMMRDRLSDEVVPRKRQDFVWLSISILIGVSVLIGSFWAFYLLGLRNNWIFFWSGFLGLVGFGLMLIHDPHYFYRRMIYACIIGASTTMSGLFFDLKHTLPSSSISIRSGPDWSETPEVMIGMLLFWGILIIVFSANDRR